MVESQSSKLLVEGSIPFSRSNLQYYNPEQFPYVIENFVEDSICNSIVEFIQEKGDLYYQPSPVEYWSNRTISFHVIKKEDIYPSLKDIFFKTTPIVNNLSLNPEPLYADTLDLVRWKTGTELPPHIDNAEPDGTPNISPWRNFSVMVYLNDDFEGGEIYWTKLNKQLKPKKGMFVVFPSDAPFQHGVKKITEGTRYTISSFYTYSQLRNIEKFM